MTPVADVAIERLEPGQSTDLELARSLEALVNEVYEANTVREAWQEGDLMLVDNIASAHSREPFTGPREVLVGMADPVSLADCSPTVDV